MKDVSPAQPALWRRAIPWRVTLWMAVTAVGITCDSSPQRLLSPSTPFVITPPPS